MIINILLSLWLSTQPRCEFEPEQYFGKAYVLNVKRYDVAKRNRCFPEHGDVLGKIRFGYEYPEGSGIIYQYLAYYDAASVCEFNGNQIACWDVPLETELASVRFIEKANPRRPDRGFLISLEVVE